MIWNPIKNRRLRRDWRLVGTLEAIYTWTDLDNEKDTAYYYLKENGMGERKCIHDGTGNLGKDGRNSPAWAERKRVSHPIYLEKIRPWLEGRYDPDIPSYESIKAKEFKDKLAGKIT